MLRLSFIMDRIGDVKQKNAASVNSNGGQHHK